MQVKIFSSPVVNATTANVFNDFEVRINRWLNELQNAANISIKDIKLSVSPISDQNSIIAMCLVTYE